MECHTESESGSSASDEQALKGQSRRAECTRSHVALILLAVAVSSGLVGLGLWLALSATKGGQVEEVLEGGCLCLFDVDRTLTGQQGLLGPNCSGNLLKTGVKDTAYTGGDLTLSPAGQSLRNTFCVSKACFVGIVTAGDCSGFNSPERLTLVQQFQEAGAKVPSTQWSGPSSRGEARRACTAADATSTLVTGCLDGTKQEAAKGIVAMLRETQKADIPASNVWMFDDRENNVGAFRSTGFNARMVSCATRDERFGTGLCGASVSEIRDEPGVTVCQKAVDLLPDPAVAV